MSKAVGREAGKPIPVREPVLEVLGSIDLGRVIRGRPCSFSVDVHNRGGTPLDVEVSSTAPSMRITPRKFEVSPGSVECVEIGFAPDGTHNSPLASITVRSRNSCVDPEQTVDVTGTVIDEVTLASNPPAIELSSPLLANAEPTRVSLDITRDDGAKVSIDRWELEAEELVHKSVTCSMAQSDGGRAEVVVHTANRAPGRYTGVLHLYEKDPLVAPLAIPITFSIMARANVAILSPRIPIVDAGGTAQLRLQNPGARSISVRTCCRVAEVEVGDSDQAVILAPGQETQLPLTYRFRAVPEVDAPIELECWVCDAGSASAPVSLQLEKVVLAPLDVRPRLELRLKPRMAAGRRSAFRVAIKNPGDSPVTVRAQTCNIGETWGSTSVTVPPHRAGTLRGFFVPPATVLGTQETQNLQLGLQWQTLETQGTETVGPVSVIVHEKTKGPGLASACAAVLLAMLLLVGGLVFALAHTGSRGRTAGPMDGPPPQPPEAPPLEAVLQQAWTLHRQAQDWGVIELLSNHESELHRSKYYAETQMLLGWSYAATGDAAAARTAFLNYWQCAPAGDAHRAQVGLALARLGVAKQNLPAILGNCAPTLSWQSSGPTSGP